MAPIISAVQPVAIGTVLAVGTLVAVFLARWHRGNRSSPAADPIGSAGFDPADTAEISARLSAIEDEQADARGRRLLGLVQQLVDRGVPARVVEVAPTFSDARIRFADGTTVVARGDTAGDLGILAALMRECSVVPSSCAIDARGVHVEFTWPANPRRVSVRVIGVDQPN